MDTENNFEQELSAIKKRKQELSINIDKIKRVLSANEYKLRLAINEEIALYKSYGQKPPKALTNPELVQILSVANASKDAVLSKYDELFSLINDKGIDKDLLKAKFNEYVAICKEKGVQVKSSQELANLVKSIKDFKEEINEVSLYDIINKISKEAEVKKDSIKQSLKEYDFASKIDFIVNKFFPAKKDGYSDEEKEKYVIFFKWAQTNETKLDDIITKEIHEEYTLFVMSEKPENHHKFKFDFKNGDFIKAIEKYKNIQSSTQQYDDEMGI